MLLCPDGAGAKADDTPDHIQAIEAVRTERITQEVFKMRKLFEIGGVVAAAVLIAFGITALVMGVNGHNITVNTLKQEQIVGTPDMTPAAIKVEAKQAGLPATLNFPTKSV